jgi:methionyl-tRNA formyltransferase
MKKSPTIVFFGSGPVAAASLTHLLTWCDVECVVTKPRAEGHRGSVPVLELALARNLRTIVPTNKRELSAAVGGESFTSHVGIVIDYGIIIAQDVIDSFPLGIINSHFSILPQWRGADPISFSLLSGQAETGVSLMRITAGLDEGDLLATKTISTYAPDTARQLTNPELTSALIHTSNVLLEDILHSYIDGAIVPVMQDKKSMTTAVACAPNAYDYTSSMRTLPSHSRKLTKQDGVLDPSTKTAVQLEREIRTFIEWPKSRITVGGKDVIVKQACVYESPRIESSDTSLFAHLAVGSTFMHEKRLFLVCLGDTLLELIVLQPSGKPAMNAQGFLAGYSHLLS